MKEYKVDDHVSSFLPEGKEWKLVWHDEFDGPELDKSKWFYRMYMAGEKHKTYIEDAISFDGNSNIVFHLIERDGKYYSSTIQTGENFTDRPNGESRNMPQNFMHKYGYYECRCKLNKERLWWTAFWLQAPEVAIGDPIIPEKNGVEVDIMENFKPGTYIPHYLHWGGYGEGYKYENSVQMQRYATDEDAVTPEETEDGFHTFAVHWEKDGYTFYVDGKQSGVKCSKAVSHTEQFILLFTECYGHRNLMGYDAKKDYKSGARDEFVVDYVRVFDEV
ncbi:MAG: glycoside hydrolase family 16 protein [Lachnospiraceae bacterium]|nr:glycoside hydrolase family 16 protein [Lachnospiraceae bacterium]